MTRLAAAAARLAALFRWQNRSAALPILMYHKVKPVALDPWTVTVERFDQQCRHLAEAGYRAISCAELLAHLDGRGTLPNKPLLITLDDAYQNNLTHAYPLLERYGLRATMFVPAKFIGGENEWDGGGEPLLNYEQLKQLSPERIEFGLHSYAHGNYRRMPLEAIQADLRQAIAELEAHGLPFAPVLAYPFGAYPKFGPRARALREMLKQLGIECALRVGNRVNYLPIANRYAITRLDIRSDDTLESFRRKLLTAR